MNLFTTLMPILAGNGKLTLTIEDAGKGSLAVLVVPHLPPASEGLSPEMEQVRATLATPMRIVAPASEIDAEFIGKLTAYQAIRSGVMGDRDTLSQLEEAAKNAKKAVAKAAAKRPVDAPVQEDGDDGENDVASAPTTAPEPTSMLETSNPDSLI